MTTICGLVPSSQCFSSSLHNPLTSVNPLGVNMGKALVIPDQNTLGFKVHRIVKFHVEAEAKLCISKGC
jgi:hypothetical protein